jgi:hypothetical protein
MVTLHQSDTKSGLAQIKQGVDVKEVVPDGLVFQDGSKIVADVIVLAWVQILLHLVVLNSFEQHRASADYF